LGVSFGAKGANVGAGLEAFAMMPIGRSAVFNRCALRGSGVGPLAQVGLVGADPHITLALQAGAGIDRKAYLFLGGHLGATRRFGATPAWGVSLGPRIEWVVFNLHLATDPVLEQTLLAGGVRYPPTAGICPDSYE
jgi:hypothetical protein